MNFTNRWNWFLLLDKKKCNTNYIQNTDIGWNILLEVLNCILHILKSRACLHTIGNFLSHIWGNDFNYFNKILIFYVHKVLLFYTVYVFQAIDITAILLILYYS